MALSSSLKKRAIGKDNGDPMRDLVSFAWNAEVETAGITKGTRSHAESYWCVTGIPGM
jgi:hypothetical protein